MKRKISFLLIAILIAAFYSPICIADDDTPTSITLNVPDDPGDTPIFRSPSFIPIEACFYYSISTIFARFIYDLGRVSVVIENQTTGEFVQNTINGTQGDHAFLISGNSGVYEISFKLPDQSEYVGFFEIE